MGSPTGSQPGSSAQTATIRTRIPSRLDRLPWSRFHWLIVAGLGTVWILDGLEVTNVGAVGARLTDHGSGISITSSGIATAAAIYVIGACFGALLFGQLTDRFGRKKLFMITLGIYIAATTATAFSFAPWFFYVCRFVTGSGIGGEYASINSAIDELIPARARGRVDLAINGSYWLGSIAGSAAALFFLDKAVFAADFGWRLSFGVGAVIGLAVLLVRRNVPESPRWLFIHGREEEAEAIVDDIERGIEQDTGESLREPDTTLEVRQREAIPFREIARVAFKAYPKRSVLGIALFVGQAFLYNGVTFNIGTLFTKFEHASSGQVPIFTIVYAAGNFAGPLLLGRLFDTVGRKPMIAGTYLASAAAAAVMAILFRGGHLGPWGLEGFIVLTFFFASSGASAAYLTVSEIFPMETRALAIAFFYAVGTGLGGIIGPLLFGRLFGSGVPGEVALAFWIGAAVMAVGGIVELFLGVKAEGQALEDIAKPITVADAESAGAGESESGEETAPEHREALRCRQRAEEARAWAAEHRARAHELRARAVDGDADAEGRIDIEQALAEVEELRARGLDERSVAHELRREAAQATEGANRQALEERVEAAEERARALAERAEALTAESAEVSERHRALAEAASEQARASEHRAHAERCRGESGSRQGAAAEVAHARAQMHDEWALMHEHRSRAAAGRAEAGGDELAASHERRARAHEELALAAEQRVQAAERRAGAEELRGAEEAAERDAAAARRERHRREVEERIRRRLARRTTREREGLRRFRPGPGTAFGSPGVVRVPGVDGRLAEEQLDHEIDAIGRALEEHGATEREELARLVGARYWGPGRFGPALREAVAEGRVRRLSPRTYGPAADTGDHDGGGDGDRGSPS